MMSVSTATRAFSNIPHRIECVVWIVWVPEERSDKRVAKQVESSVSIKQRAHPAALTVRRKRTEVFHGEFPPPKEDEWAI